MSDEAQKASGDAGDPLPPKPAPPQPPSTDAQNPAVSRRAAPVSSPSIQLTPMPAPSPAGASKAPDPASKTEVLGKPAAAAAKVSPDALATAKNQLAAAKDDPDAEAAAIAKLLSDQAGPDPAAPPNPYKPPSGTTSTAMRARPLGVKPISTQISMSDRMRAPVAEEPRRMSSGTRGALLAFLIAFLVGGGVIFWRVSTRWKEFDASLARAQAASEEADWKRMETELSDGLYNLGIIPHSRKVEAQSLLILARMNQDKLNAFNEMGLAALERKEYGEAARQFADAVNLGNAQSAGELGNLYYNGLGVAEDRAKAEVLYQHAADQGFSNGYMGLFNCRQAKAQSEAELTALRDCLSKAAKLGEHQAAYELGLALGTGKYGYKKDLREAIAWMVKARDWNNPKAEELVTRFSRELTEQK